jgi:BirA family biotin operon repressor/biotin-[acetyl-CoA-carboxylase] ligase
MDSGDRIVGRRVVRAGEVGSTQDEARSLALAGEPEGTAVVAEAQTAGRGRHGRAWSSPPGAGLYLSVVLRPGPHIEPGLLTLAAGVAVAEACGTGRLKWPNDLLAPDGRKLAGILAEADGSGGRIDFVVLGVGVNLSSHMLPPDLGAAGLDRFGPVDRDALLQCLLDRLDLWYGRLARPDEVLDAWRRLDCLAGRRVVASGLAGSIEGEAVGVDRTGALLVRGPSGAVTRVVAGDVRLL